MTICCPERTGVVISLLVFAICGAASGVATSVFIALSCVEEEFTTAKPSAVANISMRGSPPCTATGTTPRLRKHKHNSCKFREVCVIEEKSNTTGALSNKRGACAIVSTN